MKNNDCAEILLVENDPADAERAMRTLKKNNLAGSPMRVNDGEEALDYLFGRGNFSERKTLKNSSVVMLDLRLPRVDGLKVLGEIKNNELTKKIPVVILPSSKEDSDISRSYEYGVNSFISKPVDFQEFAKVIGDLILYWLEINRSPVKGS